METEYDTLYYLQLISPRVGFVTSVLFYICPISLVYLIHNKQQSIEDSSCLGMVASLINCTLWFTWGFAPYALGNKLTFEPIDFCNLIGGLLNLIYLTIYSYQYTKGFNWYLLFYLFTLYDITFEIIYYEIEFSRGDSAAFKRKELIISWLASVFNIIMYITPGINIIQVFKTKNHQLISILGSILGVINSFAWLFWGCVSINHELNLLHVIVANVIGLGLCVSQVSIYYYYKGINTQSMVVQPSTEDIKDRNISTQSIKRNENDPAIFDF